MTPSNACRLTCYENLRWTFSIYGREEDFFRRRSMTFYDRDDM
jgi:hypothetical protein